MGEGDQCVRVSVDGVCVRYREFARWASEGADWRQFMFPTVRPVTALNMNYAVGFLAAVLLAAMVYWYVNGRHFYTGPLVEAVLVRDDNSSGADEPIAEKKDAEA